MQSNLLKSLVFLLVPAFLFPSCGTKREVPLTGRKMRIVESAFSDAAMLANSKSLYPSLISQFGGISNNSSNKAMVDRVANKLINAANNYLRTHGFANELKYYEWEVHLVKSNAVNAFCMAGGKICVLEGILPAAHNEAGLAAVLGHEIGHALAHHTAEQLTKEQNKKILQTVGAVGVGIAGVATKADMNVVNEVINAGVSLSNDVMAFVEMRYSRKHELEADRIGMALMAMAGYDPHEAPKVWARMTDMYGETPGTLLDSHPSNAKRRKELEEKWMDEAMAYYRQSNPSSVSYAQTTSSASSASSASTSTRAAAAASSSFASSNGGSAYTVTATSLNVRTSPSAAASSMGTLKKGQTVQVQTISAGWATITFNGKTGYVKSNFLKRK